MLHETRQTHEFGRSQHGPNRQQEKPLPGCAVVGDFLVLTASVHTSSHNSLGSDSPSRWSDAVSNLNTDCHRRHHTATGLRACGDGSMVRFAAGRGPGPRRRGHARVLKVNISSPPPHRSWLEEYIYSTLTAKGPAASKKRCGNLAVRRRNP
jgi:hypothetical protein